ncbi:PTS fructose transporter subunit IIA [Enterococcus faecium]|uniref:PTS sugar transporter subunit IIA n=1 Tax=Enterococcus faecium TaxID=1352 RepID=UPI000B3648E9|nr:PTS fructose transporter subunit IIA [Enterococcus faecium]OUK18836.1 PTS fructose transporter subunit IIA [Enterococcus faecium]
MANEILINRRLQKMANQLFHIVITTHSTLCEVYLKATKLILMNDATGISAAPFKENTSPDDFEESMKEIISQHHLQPLIILTDLIRGTHNNVSIKQVNNNRIQIIAGINLPLLLELLMAQSAGKSIEEIDFKELLNNSQKSMVHINSLLKDVS